MNAHSFDIARPRKIGFLPSSSPRRQKVSARKLARARFRTLVMLPTFEVVMLTLPPGLSLSPSRPPVRPISPDSELRGTFLSCRASQHKDTSGDAVEFQFSVDLFPASGVLHAAKHADTCGMKIPMTHSRSTESLVQSIVNDVEKNGTSTSVPRDRSASSTSSLSNFLPQFKNFLVVSIKDIFAKGYAVPTPVRITLLFYIALSRTDSIIPRSRRDTQPYARQQSL